ncbi:N-formylglutamate amidohydrolase [Marilutibacter chinensis]|uniref:N-formylglutamate amidohydrolase n=1 Tax=Marilutibacter chinensis TaxID=2912247 RepID=A0ABS9HUT7_9GAMM|nr:N-formylglutamate amidohydrolase [Lysobacter chinensis]MCF7222078.1 N-formylglutamate amidohydrolase [Lysobacter chinensis]
MDDNTPATMPFFSTAERLVLQRPSDDWDLVVDEGPVIATAIHDGHLMRPSLIAHLAIDEDQRRREEDPMTGVLVSAGDVRLCVRASRFQVDLNRSRERALSTNLEDTWGVRVWKGPVPERELELSLAAHDRFYAMVTELVEHLIARWGCVLVLDIHSYNHRRAGADARPATAGGNPDIDIGATTLDRSRWGAVVERMIEVLGGHTAGGRRLDVRENVRYPDGGHFPEWLHATYGDRVCAITLEYKKIYMDEWTGQADIEIVEDLRKGLDAAVAAVRAEFIACR